MITSTGLDIELDAIELGVPIDLDDPESPLAASEERASSSSSPSPARSIVAALGFTAAVAATAAIGALATRRTVRSPWYLLLRKPSFQPPRKAFGPVWTGLYAAMAASAWRVWRAPPSEDRTRALVQWSTQLGLNGAWSWIFFGAKKPKLALGELSALLASVVAYAVEARKVDPVAAWLVAPYVGWTAFAGVLNEEIARRN